MPGMLARELRDSVGRERVRRGLLGRRVLLGLSVDGGRRGKDDARAREGRGFENPLAGEHVPLDVEREDVTEATHAWLSREVEDAVPVCEVELVARKVESAHLDPARVPLLHRRVVVVGETVDPENLVTRALECLGKVRADESRGSGDDVSHRVVAVIARTLP